MKDWKLSYLKERKRTLEARAQVLQLQYNKIHEDIQEAQNNINQHMAEVTPKKKEKKGKNKK